MKTKVYNNVNQSVYCRHCGEDVRITRTSKKSDSTASYASYLFDKPAKTVFEINILFWKIQIVKLYNVFIFQCKKCKRTTRVFASGGVKRAIKVYNRLAKKDDAHKRILEREQDKYDNNKLV